MDVDLTDLLSLDDFEIRAREVLPRMVYEFIASGAGDEHTIRWNREAFGEFRLRPRVPESAAPADLGIDLLGRRHTIPILLAPTAYHRVLHPDGELATAEGARDSGVAWVVSTASTTSVEEIAARGGKLWFQLYVQEDRGFTREIVSRAEAAGCEALCLTVDTPVLGPRNRQARARFALPEGMATPHLWSSSESSTVMGRRRTPVTWKEVEWLRTISRIPILLKGILNPDDAERALQSGMAGVIVSNHGGRNLDTLPPALQALPEVVDRVGGRGAVLMDGGIRRGTDVLKALALGADAVLIGRPYCYGVGVGGAAGVRRVIDILREEVEMSLLLLGRTSIAEVDRQVLWAGRRKGEGLPHTFNPGPLLTP